MVGTTLLRLLMRLRLGQPISDGTSGLYAVDRSALALLADDYMCEAPEVEALVRITDAKLKLVEVPVHMRQREHGESSFKRQARRRAGGHDRAGVVRGQAAARPPPASAGSGLARALQPLRRRPIAAEAVVSSTRPGELAAAAELTRGRERPQQRRRRRPVAGVVQQMRDEPGERRPPVPRPGDAVTVAPAAAAVSRLWLRGAAASDVVCGTRGERAATMWSTSMTARP